MKMVSPDGDICFETDGKEYRPDENGVFEIPDNAVELAKRLGYVPVPKKPKKNG